MVTEETEDTLLREVRGIVARAPGKARGDAVALKGPCYVTYDKASAVKRFTTKKLCRTRPGRTEMCLKACAR